MHNKEFKKKIISFGKNKGKAAVGYKSFVAKSERTPKALINAEKHRVNKLARSGKKRYDYPEDQRPVKIYYVRYADDFLMGVDGPREVARTILDQVKNYISSNLHFTCSKAELLHARSN